MSGLLPLWATIVVSVLLVAGSALALLGAIGLVRFPSFYQRLHAPSLATSGAAVCIIGASVIGFTLLTGRAVVYELLVGFFIMCTTPVTLMLLGRAALYRDRKTERLKDQD